MEREYSHIAGCRLLIWKTGALIALVVCCASSGWAQSGSDREKTINHLRSGLEQPFLESGGFSTFDCSVTSGKRPTRPFTCDAGTSAGNHYQYLLVPDPAQGLIIDLITEPAAQLEYEWLPAMEAPCRLFLKQFDQAEWERIYNGFHPNLQKLISVAKLETDLPPIRELLGPIGEPTLESYSARDGGRHELQYLVPTQNGKAAFRCGLNVNESGVTVLAYLITPYPGSALYESSLEERAARQLSDIIGAEVTSLEIPYNQLTNLDDKAFGVAVLANAESAKIRITRSGRHDDFSELDYNFAVIKDSKP